MRSDQQLYDLDRQFGNEFHENLSKLNDKLLFLLQRHTIPYVLKSFLVILLVFDQNLQIELMLIFLLCELHCLLIVVEVLTYFDGSLDIEKIAFQGGLRQELTQVFNLLLFYIAVEQKGCVLLFGYFLFMHLF